VTWARLVILTLAGAGAIPACWFAVVLNRRGQRWRRTPVGRFLMTATACLGVLLAVSAASVAVTMTTGRPATATWFAIPYLASFVGVDVALWRGLWLLTHPRDDSPTPDAGISEDAHTS